MPAHPVHAGSFAPRIRQRGFGLIELVLVLGVLALMAIAAFILFGSVQNRTEVEIESQRLTSVAAGVRSLFAGHNTYSGLTTVVGNQARIFPASMNGGDFTATASISSTWHGPVSLIPLGSPPTRFIVRYDAVPTAACINWLPVSSFSFAKVRVGASETVVHDVTETGTPVTSRLDVDAAVRACSESDTVPIEWISN